MPEPVFMGFDFGLKRIGVAIGQRLTGRATPLATLHAVGGVPDWNKVSELFRQWRPCALIVGLPTALDGTELYTTKLAEKFAEQLKTVSELPVHLVDERLSTVEARSQLFEMGGYRKLKKSEIDSLAACIILEQWLLGPEGIL
jgi:putative holliday junction resolvase